jgi:hypothetical protein
MKTRISYLLTTAMLLTQLTACAAPVENSGNGTAFVMGWLLGPGHGGNTINVTGYTITPTITVTGLMGSVELKLNGGEGLFFTGSGGTASFTTPIADGASYTLTATQRATFAVDAGKQNWVSQSCTIDSGSTTVTIAGASVTPTLSISCVNNPYVYDPDHTLIWMRCSQGQTYQAATNDCLGAGGGAPYGAGSFQYCTANSDACNDQLPAGEDSTLVNGHLDGTGTSGAHTTCNTLNIGPGTYGKSNWRVPRITELEKLVELTGTSGNNAIELVLFPNNVASLYWSSSSYAPSVILGWGVYFDDGGSSSDVKTSAYYVRCVAVGP